MSTKTAFAVMLVITVGLCGFLFFRKSPLINDNAQNSPSAVSATPSKSIKPDATLNESSRSNTINQPSNAHAIPHRVDPVAVPMHEHAH